MDKKEIIENSKAVFEAHPKEDTIIATTDGNYFLKSAVNLAKDHARKLGTKTFEITKGLKVLEDETIEKKEESFDAYTVKELMEFAKENGIEITARKKADIIAEIELGLNTDDSEKGTEGSGEGTDSTDDSEEKVDTTDSTDDSEEKVDTTDESEEGEAKDEEE